MNGEREVAFARFPPTTACSPWWPGGSWCAARSAGWRWRTTPGWRH